MKLGIFILEKPAGREISCLIAGISLPTKVVIYTGLGAGFWSLILIAVGFFYGENQAAIEQNLSLITVVVLAFALLLVLFYLLFRKKKQ
jgi:LPXTG-motif cell wall-anchored protein